MCPLPHLARLCVCDIETFNSGSSLCFNCSWIAWLPSVVAYTINRQSAWNLFQTGWINSELDGGQSENRALIRLKHCVSISWAKFYGWMLLTLKTIWETMQRSSVCERMSHAPQKTLRFPSFFKGTVHPTTDRRHCLLSFSGMKTCTGTPM